MVTDLAPESRRGEAISSWSIAVYGGLAFGPTLGEWLLADGDYARVWWVSAGLAVASGMVGLLTRETVSRLTLDGGAGADRPPLISRAALGPGVVLFLGMVGLAGFAAFVPLYVGEIDMEDSSGVFLLYGCTILAVRILGARIPDRIGPLRAGTIATVTAAAGMVVIAAVESPAGLYAGTFVFSLGMSLLYPAMLTLALTGVPPRERGSAVGTISSFFDLSQGLGAAVLGGSVALSGYRGAFVTSAILAFVGAALLRGGIDRRTKDPIDPDAAELARQHVEPEPP
jgi:MFS family permease